MGTYDPSTGPQTGRIEKYDNFNWIRLLFGFVTQWSWSLLNDQRMLRWSPLRFSTIGKPHSENFQNVVFLTNFQPWPNVNLMSTIYHNTNLMWLFSDDFDKWTCATSVRFIYSPVHQFLRRDLCDASKNKGFRFGRKSPLYLRPGKCFSPCL